MTFDKQFWARLADLHPLATYPPLPCPYCSQQTLCIDVTSLCYRDIEWFSKDKTLRSSLESKHYEVSEVFKENEILGLIFGVGTLVDLMNYQPVKFSGFFECTKCAGCVAVAGTALNPKGSAQKSAKPTLRVEYFSPPVPMFVLDSAIPERVATEVMQAFQHFHCDQTASGTKIRRAMERVCEALGYKKKTLHESIEALSKEYPQEAKWLRTLKLVGNEASHADKVTEEDLLTSFQVLKAILDVFRRQAMTDDIDKALPILENKYKN